MRNESHETFIGVIRKHIIEWRKSTGMSREAVVQTIVEAHARIGGPEATGIVFDPTTRDAFERMKVNADRVFRWLADDAKDNNLLPANFVRSILAAMPADVRLHCAGDLLRSVGIDVCGLETPAGAAFNPADHVTDFVRETAEATVAMVNVTATSTVHDLEVAEKELGDAVESANRAHRAVRAALAMVRSVPGVVRNLRRAG